uniref:NADPH:adrenodoxin oxidoreductase, mitochondrial n=1 Tax=Ciona intestinalis TaxID=7719 RepID=F6ZIP8_CIOIN
STDPQICIVGSGPAGFGVAQSILKHHPTAKVDMFEQSPVPYGLIRRGVSPDHQDVKNCIHGYERTAVLPGFSFYGNIEVGSALSLVELQAAYHAVVLCTGAQEERKLGIPRENLRNIFTSLQFVGWYNGDTNHQDVNVDVGGRTAVIVGHGNVALDCARMLLKPTHMFKNTDISSEAYNKLMKSEIKKVYLIGRRGPLQMACTRKELAEITDLEGVVTQVDTNVFTPAVNQAINNKDLKRRKQHRLVKYLMKVANVENKYISKEFEIKYLRSPHSITTNDDVTIAGINFNINKLEGDNVYEPLVTSSGELEHISCDLLISCIGYTNKLFDPNIPYKGGKMVHDNGRIKPAQSPGLYASGWCRDGPLGVLADTSNSSTQTSTSVLNDIDDLITNKPSCRGYKDILPTLEEKNIDVITWHRWQTIDEHEVNEGRKVGKVREKLLSEESMIEVSK